MNIGTDTCIRWPAPTLTTMIAKSIIVDVRCGFGGHFEILLLLGLSNGLSPALCHHSTSKGLSHPEMCFMSWQLAPMFIGLHWPNTPVFTLGLYDSSYSTLHILVSPLQIERYALATSTLPFCQQLEAVNHHSILPLLDSDGWCVWFWNYFCWVHDVLFMHVHDEVVL